MLALNIISFIRKMGLNSKFNPKIIPWRPSNSANKSPDRRNNVNVSSHDMHTPTSFDTPRNVFSLVTTSRAFNSANINASAENVCVMYTSKQSVNLHNFHMMGRVGDCNLSRLT